QPGECVDIGIRFSPSANGAVSATLTVTTDGEPANVVLALNGTGGPIGAAPVETRVVATLTAMPNPATDVVTVALTLIRPATVDVMIIDSRGSIVHRFESREAASEYRFAWDGRSTNGAMLSSGSYRVVARAGGETTSTAVVLVR
ncbi:MAG: hypothetical protein H7X80_12245, partial [bacterium]|nr:hypothetical protein [Candidatus Kapabacteria bacterium]